MPASAEPFLATEAPESQSKRLRGGSDDAKLCVNCCQLCVVLFFALCAFGVALRRNQGCSIDALRNVEPPYANEILPTNAILVEQQNWFQLTKIVDVFDADAPPNSPRVGYFYDMQFLFFMRFGYSDAQDRIWFEAKYPTFASRFHFALQYFLQRCDEGVGGRLGAVYDIKEDWWARKWFCFNNCVRKFHVTRQAEGDSSEMTFPENAVDVDFNSTLTWSWGAARHEWYMNMTNAQTHAVEAFAQQRFFWGGKLGWTLLSNWTVDVKSPTPAVPNWVVGFMAALDDITEEH